MHIFHCITYSYQRCHRLRRALYPLQGQDFSNIRLFPGCGCARCYLDSASPAAGTLLVAGGSLCGYLSRRDFEAYCLAWR